MIDLWDEDVLFSREPHVRLLLAGSETAAIHPGELTPRERAKRWSQQLPLLKNACFIVSCKEFINTECIFPVGLIVRNENNFMFLRGHWDSSTCDFPKREAVLAKKKIKRRALNFLVGRNSAIRPCSSSPASPRFGQRTSVQWQCRWRTHRHWSGTPRIPS